MDLAMQEGKEDVVAFMTADVDLIPFARGLLPAVQRGDASVVAALLRLGRERPDINAKDKRKMPVLHHAVKAGHEEVVRTLLSSAPDEGCEHEALAINARDRYGKTALDVADESGSPAEILSLLKRHGALVGDDVDD
eukprot:TRINITY_DN7459_c0_g1_i3.p1 TRINITY_DN7459_c0_g1~~TRINITY_DN7459_c0_g1_i3.p1  ORF type:complete len:137 (-),score=36.95 TRINITY_DN7459_c0_g1_i3:33-443(-)